MEAIAVIAEEVSREEDKEALLRHAGMIKRGSYSGLPEELDRKNVEERYCKVLELLGERELKIDKEWLVI
jgi:uncharacterized membrane protein